MRPALSTVLSVIAITGGFGCGGSSDAADAQGGALPECARELVGDRRAEPPRQLPSGFPLPPGLVLTHAEVDELGRIVVNGFAPGDIATVGRFFEDELPPNGYRVGRGDAEEFEKEAPFTGGGFRGQWRVFGSPDCREAVRVLVILIPQA